MDEATETWAGAADADGDPADLATLPVRKRGCELAVEQVYGPEAALVVRAGSIVGPHDNLGLHNVVPDGPNTTMGGLVDACV